MKNVTLEIYVEPSSRICHCLRSMPSYGESIEIPNGARQRLIITDGLHRVKIGVFNATLPIEQIKSLARLAVGSNANLDR